MWGYSAPFGLNLITCWIDSTTLPPGGSTRHVTASNFFFFFFLLQGSWIKYSCEHIWPPCGVFVGLSGHFLCLEDSQPPKCKIHLLLNSSGFTKIYCIYWQIDKTSVLSCQNLFVNIDFSHSDFWVSVIGWSHPRQPIIEQHMLPKRTNCTKRSRRKIK